MDQYIGKLLDNRYEILELIGTGGMANVYKARCNRLNRLVAVKILKSDLAEDAEFRRRFRDESQAVAQLSHANIVSVYDVSSSGDTEYIVMELIDGITLKQYMERRGKMDWREALHFITQIMRGLSHAHSRGIIHRDIKPHNVMVLRDGSVKVADFGIACLANSGQTLTQEALGSVHYISPEQARGDRTDARSDIYSAGVVLYEMLTGRLPFEGDSAVSVAIQHLSSIPLNPREINPDVPEALELITMKAMNANVDKRYDSADAMLEDLEKFHRDPNVDMEYIRESLNTPADDEPTQPIQVKDTLRSKKGENEEDDEPRFSKTDKKRMAILIGGFAGALVLVLLVFKLIFGGSDTTTTGHVVPDILGKTVEEAMAMKEVKDIFEIEVVGTREDETYQPGEIVEQDPVGGRTRKSNLVIKVTVCVEAEKKQIPDVIGMDVESAKVQLKGLGLDLKISTREEFSDTFDKGQVISVTPGVGEDVKKGHSVTLVYSKGSEEIPITVPSFSGMDIETAALQAEALGLAVGEHEYAYNSAPKGQVIAQSISATTTVKKGTEIVFTVSEGDEPSQTVSKDISVTIPNGADGFEGMVTVFFVNGDEVGRRIGNVGDTITCTLHGASGSTQYVQIQYVYGNDSAPLHEEELPVYFG